MVNPVLVFVTYLYIAYQIFSTAYFLPFPCLRCRLAFVLHLLRHVHSTEKPERHEEKQLATWGTDVPDNLVLDRKLLAEALKKVSCGLLLFIECVKFMHGYQLALVVC